MAIPPATANETDVNVLRERVNYLRVDNESLRARVAELESIAYSDDGAGGDGMRLFLENVAMKQQLSALVLVGWLDGRTRFFSVDDPMYKDRHDGMREVFAARVKS